MSKQRIPQIKSVDYKKYQFFILYGLINLVFFYTINTVVSSMHTTFADLFVTNLSVDGADFSIFANMFAMPIAFFMATVNIVFLLVYELAVLLLFKFVYFKTTVREDEKVELGKHIKTMILYCALFCITGAGFLGGIQQIVFFTLLYFPFPLLTFVLVYKDKKLS
ncbi:MAG: hypothetical protein AB7E30_03310 [Lawsonibacter sp.]